MTVDDGRALGAGLLERAKNILLTPKTEWDAIADEPATVQGLYTRYAMILAALQAIGTLVSNLGFLSWANMFGGPFGVHVSVSPVWALLEAVKDYVISLAMVYVLALIFDGLATNFGATRSRIQALKVSTYSATAFWIAGFFMIVPPLGWLLGIAACFYTVYLIYLGLRRVMLAP